MFEPEQSDGALSVGKLCDGPAGFRDRDAEPPGGRPGDQMEYFSMIQSGIGSALPLCRPIIA